MNPLHVKKMFMDHIVNNPNFPEGVIDKVLLRNLDFEKLVDEVDEHLRYKKELAGEFVDHDTTWSEYNY